MASAVRKLKDNYTYQDYLSWETDVRYEILDGVAYALAAPATIHQRILRRLSSQLDSFLKDKKCELFFAPFDVRLEAQIYDTNVVQPDLLVVCDQSKIDDKGCNGVPDFIIEILSPSSIQIDMLKKYNIYLRMGVREYWIVDPENKIVHTYTLKDGNYIANIYGVDNVVSSQVLEGCDIKLAEIFEQQSQTTDSSIQS